MWLLCVRARPKFPERNLIFMCFLRVKCSRSVPVNLVMLKTGTKIVQVCFEHKGQYRFFPSVVRSRQFLCYT